MPVTTRYSAALEQPYCESGPASPMERRNSNSTDSLDDRSNSSSGSHSRQISQEGSAEFIPTRVTKVTSPKPASNPMQFVKIQPCHLYKSAQEQLKKVEEVKKVQEKTKDEAEEWQSNLDNWKSSRRKRQESIIERVTEVKKLEEEEAYLRARRKSKTFNEMMEERYSRGRKVSLPIYLDDDGNDLSDLGIGTSSGKSSISEDYHSTSEDNNTEYDNHHEAQNGKKENGENGVNGHDSSSEEYTYERAIQSYVNYAEAHVKSKLQTSDSDSKDKANSVLSNGHSKRRASEPCRVSVKRGSKIEERLSAFEHHAEKSVQRSGVKVQSVDVLKRRELFERSGTDSKDVKPPKHIAHKSNSSRDQLSSSENEDSPVENNKPMNGNSGESMNQNFDNRFTNGFDGSSISSTDDMYESRQTPRSLDSLEVESQASSLTTNDDSQLSRSDGFERDQSIDNLDATQNLPSDKCSHTVDDLLGLHDDIEQVHGSSMLEPLKSPSASENEMKISNCTSHCEGDDQIIDLEIQVVKQDESARKEVSTAFVDVAQALSMPQEETSCTREEVLPATKPEENHVLKKETPVKTMPLAQLDSLEAEIIPLESKVSEVQSETLTQQHNVEVSSQPAMCGGVQSAVEELIVQTSSNNVPQEKRSEEVMEAQLHDDSVFLDNPPETKGLPQLNASVQDKNNDIILGINSDLIPNIPLTTDVGFVPGLAFPLDLPTTTTAEPPKEKPPPPPVDLEDDVPECSVKRMESTKRLKKEIRRKRSDFLGIEDHSDDSYLEQQLSVAPPPDMATLLQEERRLEQQMYQQVFSETDSNQGETTESRDSGVELDRNHGDELWNTANIADNNATHVNDEELSKAFQNSANIAEDIIMKKEREILDIMEQEQQWKYNNNVNAEDNVIGERLAEKLKQLEEEKIQLEKERAEEERRKQEEEDARQMEQMRLREREEQLRQQETVVGSPSKLYPGNREDEVTPGEALYMEKERLQKEQEELQRQRETLERVQQQQQLQQHQQQQLQHQQFQQQQEYQQQANDIQAMNGSSRMPSADSIPQQVRDEPHHMGSVPQLGQQMSRQTLHALSATPRSRLIPTDTWIAKKKNEGQRRENFNYQHWLIQEAEHRRIMEQQQRQAHYRSPQPLSQKQLQCWTTTSQPPVQPPRQPGDDKPLPDAIIQTLTQRVQNRVGYQDQKARARKRYDVSPSPREGSEPRSKPQVSPPGHNQPMSPGHNRISPSAPHVGHGQPLMHGPSPMGDQHEKMLSVSGKKKCSHCGEELGRGAAMIIESLRLFYHIDCFKCCVCHVQLGDGLNGTDVRVRNNKLHCHNCYSNDDGLKFSCV